MIDNAWSGVPPLVDPDKYLAIPPLSAAEKEGCFFQHFPGVYCVNCGDTFALYSYSAPVPDGVDGAGKPFYRKCLTCLRTSPER